MSSKPTEPKYAPVLTNGTATTPVNASFAGPDVNGVLNAVPPMVQSGIDFAPLVAITGVFPPSLGITGRESPKTHG